jgi:hypothetical protein
MRSWRLRSIILFGKEIPMNPKQDALSLRASSRQSFVISAVMAIVMLAFAVGGFIDQEKIVRSWILLVGSVGAMITCFSTRPKK